MGWEGRKRREGWEGGGRGKGRGCGGARKVVCPGARAGFRRAWGEGEEKREGKGRTIKTPPLLNGLATACMPFGLGKLEWCGYSMMKKFDDTFSDFDRILMCGRLSA